MRRLLVAAWLAIGVTLIAIGDIAASSGGDGPTRSGRGRGRTGDGRSGGPADGKTSTVDTCDLYLPGHNVHYIQMRKSHENGPLVPGTLVAADGLDLTVELPEGVRTYRTHQTRLLKRVVPIGGPVFVDE